MFIMMLLLCMRGSRNRWGEGWLDGGRKGLQLRCLGRGGKDWIRRRGKGGFAAVEPMERWSTGIAFDEGVGTCRLTRAGDAMRCEVKSPPTRRSRVLRRRRRGEEEEEKRKRRRGRGEEEEEGCLDLRMRYLITPSDRARRVGRRRGGDARERKTSRRGGECTLGRVRGIAGRMGATRGAGQA
jgi:hypothetical protein